MTIYKKCDIRGKFGTELTVVHAQRLGVALSRVLSHEKPILIGGDGRIFTPVLQKTLIESLLANDMDVIDLGMVSTPAFYFARQKLNILAGVMVTASHNPASDNGFKLTLGKYPITPVEMEAIARIMESGDPGFKGERGSLKTYSVIADYSAHLRRYVPELQNLRVVIDCSNGMSALVAEPIWSITGAKVTMILDHIDGRFPTHEPNPAKAENLHLLSETVITSAADLGICFDGDGDRVGFVDEKGCQISNDKVIALFALRALAKGPAPIVYDQKCSRIVADTIRQAGGTPVLEQSGHTFIKRTFLLNQAPYAGEVTGHHFFSEIQGDDGMVAALFFCELLARSGKKTSDWLATIPEYPITPDIRISIDTSTIGALLNKLETQLGESARIDHRDGLRFEFPDSWCLIRPSVTEPMITVRFEGISQKALDDLIARVIKVTPELSPALHQFQSQARREVHG